MECGSSFPSPQALDAHMRLVHVPVAHTCAQCGLSFKDAWHLKRHMFTHGVADSDTPQVKNVCVLCNAIFPDSWHLSKHLKSHEGGTISMGSGGMMPMPGMAGGVVRRRGRGRPRGSTAARMLMRAEMPEWTDPNSPYPPYFADSYRRPPGLKADTMEFYCGICGESLGRSKFSTHSLNHFHDVFEVRRQPGNSEVPLAEPETPGECMACKEMGRKVRTMMEVMGNS